MNTYFCPNCGRNYDAEDCIEQGELLRCPQCPDYRVMMRGRMLTAFGLLILCVATQVAFPFVLTAGILVGGALCITGMIRSFRQIRARRRHRDEEGEDEDRPYEELDAEDEERI